MPWSSLESSTTALPSVWRRRIGAQFEVFRAAFLQSRPEPARFFPCQKCGCAHEVIVHAPEDLVCRLLLEKKKDRAWSRPTPTVWRIYCDPRQGQSFPVIIRPS